MSVVWVWSGAMRSTSVWVRGEVDGSSVRLAVDTDPALTAPEWYGPVAPDATTDVASIVADELEPATRYFYALEVDSVLDLDHAGSFRTAPLPGSAGGVEFWASSCAGSGTSDWIVDRVSNRPVFGTIAGRGFDFGLHLGDLHYRDIGSGVHVPEPFDAAAYRQAFRDVLTFNGTLGHEARQGQLYRSAPIAYIWDDHDYGPNDADGTLPHKDEAGLAYRQCVPHYSLSDVGNAIYQSFHYGPALFALLDVRFYRDPSSDPDEPGKTMLGSAQKEWLHDLLAASGADLLVLGMGSQWSRPTGTHADSWAAYSHERGELVDMFGDLGWLDKMLVLQGDNHGAGIDDGSNVPGGMPLFQFAPLDSNPASGSGPHRFNVARSGGQRGQWGSVRIEVTP